MTRVEFSLRLAVLVVVALSVPPVLAAPPAVQWLKTYPRGTRTEGDWVAQTADRGYVVAGTWRPNDESFDFYLVKTDSLGNLQWDKPLGVGPVAWVFSGGLTRDGGYILVGRKQDEWHAWALLVKTNAQGDTQWSRTFQADTQPHRMTGLSAQQTRDGGYIISGFCWWDGAYLIKTDSAGNVLWQRAFRAGYESGYYPARLPVQQTDGGGFILGTKRDSVLRLIKTDSSGIQQWEHQYPGLGVSEGMSVQQTRDSGYVVTGVAASPSRASDHGDVYLLKTDASGTLQWKRTFGRTELDNGRYVSQTRDGGYVMAGITDDDGSEYHVDGYVVRTDSLGNAIWTKSIGEPDVKDDARCVRQTADGGYIVTGWMGFREGNQGYMYLMKLAPEQSK